MNDDEKAFEAFIAPRRIGSPKDIRLITNTAHAAWLAALAHRDAHSQPAQNIPEFLDCVKCGQRHIIFKPDTRLSVLRDVRDITFKHARDDSYSREGLIELFSAKINAEIARAEKEMGK